MGSEMCIRDRMNRPADAEKEFLAEIQVFPQGLDARVGLAVTYASMDRRPDAIRVVLEMVRDVPRPDSYATGVRALRILQEPAAAARLRRPEGAKDPSLSIRGRRSPAAMRSSSRQETPHLSS